MNAVNTIFVMWVTNAALALLCFFPTNTRFRLLWSLPSFPVCTKCDPGESQVVSPLLCPRLPLSTFLVLQIPVPGPCGGMCGLSGSSGLTLAPLDRLCSPIQTILAHNSWFTDLKREHLGLTKRLYPSGLQVLYWQVCNCKQLRGIMETPG